MATTYVITPNPASVNEGAGTQTFTITRSGTLSVETIYASTVYTEGYTPSGDYTGILNQSLSFALNQTSKTVTVSIINDTVVESNETFGLIVQRNTSDPATTYLAKSIFTIVDNDPLATTYSISPGTVTVNENEGTVTFTVTRSGGTPAETLFISTSTGEGSTNNGDYTGKLNETLAFTSGQTSKTVTVSIINDSVVESNETFGLLVQRNSSDSASTFLAKSTFTIHDDDQAQATTYSLTPSPTTATEGGQVTFTVTRSGDTPAETVYFSARSDGTATYSEGDFTTTSGGIPLNIPVSFSSSVTSTTVTLNIVNDGTADSGEQFQAIVQRNASDVASVYLAISSNVTINDAAQNTTYSLTPSPTTATEGGQVTFTVTRSGDTPAETVYFSARSDGTATYSEGDFTTTSGGIPLNIPVSFSSGVTSTTVTLNIVNDGTADSGEQFQAIVQRNASDVASVYLAISSNVTINDAVANATDTVANDIGTSATLAPGQTAFGTIDQNDLDGNTTDADYYQVTLIGGHRYTFSGNANVSGSDTLDALFIRLRDFGGNQLIPDMKGEGATATFDYTPISNGAYYLAVSAGGSGVFQDKTGSFTVSGRLSTARLSSSI